MKLPVIIRMPASPMNAMPIRLFISGLAARAGFDINAIEDIKIAVSEACVLLLDGAVSGELVIQADISNGLKIIADVYDAVYRPSENEDAGELSRMLIESLADEANLIKNNDERITGVRVNFKRGE